MSTCARMTASRRLDARSLQGSRKMEPSFLPGSGDLTLLDDCLWIGAVPTNWNCDIADSEYVVAGNFAMSSQESCALILELSATTFAEPRVVNQQMKLRLLCRVLATYSRRAQGVDICMQDANTIPFPGLRLRQFLHTFRCSWHVR